MTIDPAISIIMPAYNAEKYLNKAIDSIIGQSFKNWELLIGNDYSSDHTLDIIQKYAASDARIKVFNLPANLGYLLNCNFLWKKAIAKYITFQDADDWSRNDRLAIQHSFLEENEKVAICSTNYYRVNEYDNVIDEVVIDENIPLQQSVSDFIFAKIPYPIFTNSLLFRREVSDTIGFYHEFYSRKCGEDWDWLLRAIRNFKVVNLPQSLYYYRENPVGVTQQLTIDKLINKSLIAKIHETFAVEGKNLLTPSLKSELSALENEFRKPYLEDKSLLTYEQAMNNIYHKDFKSALKNLRLALYHNPLNMKYYRTLKFIILKLLFH